jgi:hypothetical protein
LPGFTPALPAPIILRGPAAEERGPTVLNQQGGDGSKGSMRSRSARARKAARAADPAVTQALKDAEWEAHHLVAAAAANFEPDILAAAAKAGWRMDNTSNVAPLPASREAQRRLKDAGIHRPVHDSGHRNWNNDLRNDLRRLRSRLGKDRLMPGTDEHAQGARKGLEKLEQKLRDKLLSLDRVTQNSPTTQSNTV